MAGKKPPSPELLADLEKALPEGGFVKKGRRKREAPQGKTLPTLGDTPESVQKYTAALAKGIEGGAITTRAAKALTDAANTHLRAVNARLRREEMERLEQMLREAKEQRKDGIAYEDACKKHKAEPLLGKWLAIELPDGTQAMKHVEK